MSELLKVKLFGRKVPLIRYKNGCDYDEVLINKPDLNKEQIELIKDSLIFSNVVDEENNKSEFIKIDTISSYDNNILFKTAINTLTKRPLPRISEEFTNNLIKQRKENGCLENILSNAGLFKAYIKGEDYNFTDISERWSKVLKLINEEYKLGILPVKSISVDDRVPKNDTKRLIYTIELKNPKIKLKILECERLKMTEFIIDFMADRKEIYGDESLLKCGIVIEDKSRKVTKYYNFNNYVDSNKHSSANFNISECRPADRRGDITYSYFISISDNYKSHDIIGHTPLTKEISDIRIGDIVDLGRVVDTYGIIKQNDEYNSFIKPYLK